MTVACNQGQGHHETVVRKEKTSLNDIPAHQLKTLIDPEGNTLASRVLLPEGYRRVEAGDNSFAGFRYLPVKLSFIPFTSVRSPFGLFFHLPEATVYL